MKQKEEELALLEFLNSSDNSLTRENILRHKFLYDMGLAAAKRGYPLTIYESEVDIEGYDIILDDGDNRKPIQLKSIIRGGKTQKWHIQKKMLRPTLGIAKAINYDCGHQSTGDGGGIVLQEVVVNGGSLQVNYYYTDLFILFLFGECIIERKNKGTLKALLSLILNYTEGKGHEKIKIIKSMFVKANSPECLLALCGLHNAVGKRDWINLLIKLTNKKDKIPKHILKKLIIDEIKVLCAEKVYDK